MTSEKPRQSNQKNAIGPTPLSAVVGAHGRRRPDGAGVPGLRVRGVAVERRTDDSDRRR
jgi:hypothetical protein